MAARRGNYMTNVRGAFREVLTTELVGLVPELGISAMPQHVLDMFVAALVAMFGSGFLQSNDRQQTIARLLSAFAPVSPQARPLVSTFIEELLEEVSRRQSEFGDDRDANRRRAHEILRNAVAHARGQGTPTAAPAVAAPVAAAAAVPVAVVAAVPAAAPAAPAAAHAAAAPAPAPAAVVAPRPAAPPSTGNVLHMVGALSEADSTTFWDIVSDIQRELNAAQDAELARRGRPLQPGERRASEEVMQLLNRVSLTQEQLRAVLRAPTQELRREAMLHALRQATSAGGTGSGFGRLWDRIMGMVETAMPTGGTTGNPLEDLRSNNERRAVEDDEVAGIR